MQQIGSGILEFDKNYSFLCKNNKHLANMLIELLFVTFDKNAIPLEFISSENFVLLNNFSIFFGKKKFLLVTNCFDLKIGSAKNSVISKLKNFIYRHGKPTPRSQIG